MNETSKGRLSDDSHLTLSKPFFCQDCSSLTLPGCHFPSAARSRMSLLSHHFRCTDPPAAGPEIVLRSLSGRCGSLKGNTRRVRVLPAARWIKMACGSHSDGNRRRHFFARALWHLFCMQLAVFAPQKQKIVSSRPGALKVKVTRWLFAAVIALNSSHHLKHMRRVAHTHTPTKSHTISQ